MHRALIVSSKYDPATGYPDREAWRVSNKRLGLRLQQHGYAVEWLEPGAGLVRKLREALATEDPLSAVVMVFSGYVLLTESGEPAILLADEHVIALRLEQLCSKAGRTFGRVLCVLDGVRGSSTRVVQEANPQAKDTSAETLLARMAVRTVKGDNVGMLVRVSPWGSSETHSDAGLCEQLCGILENLDESQALSTPELELDLLDIDESGATLCRHSKPAFVFLPARRFASEPPKPLEAHDAEHERSSQPRIDENVAPYTSRHGDDDREAWTPPPDDGEATTLVSGEDDADAPAARDLVASRASSGDREGHVAPSRGEDRPVTGTSLAPLPPLVVPPLVVPPLGVPPLNVPPLGVPPRVGSSPIVSPAAAPLVTAPSVTAPSVTAPSVTAPSVTAPPLPLGDPLPLPPLNVPPLVVAPPSPTAARAPAQDTSRGSAVLPDEGAHPLIAEPRPGDVYLAPETEPKNMVRQTSAPRALGTPPPLPSERAALATAAPATAAPHSSPLGARPLGTPPPLPAEREATALVPPPLPYERGADMWVPPPLPVAEPPASQVSHPDVSPVDAAASRTSEPGVASSRDLGVPPPLPAERDSLGATALAEEALRDVSSDATSGATEPTDTSSDDNRADAPRSGETQSAHASTAPSAPSFAEASPNANHPVDAAGLHDSAEASPNANHPIDAAAPHESADASEGRTSQSPSRPSPPPRRRRDSAAPPATGAPSIPPPVLSPESWRPQPDANAVARDEAALLSLAQAAIAAGDDATALSHAEQCLGSFPESAQALQLAASVLVARGDFEALAARYADLVSRQTKPESAAQLCAAASRLWLTQLNDPANARIWLERGLELDATNASLQRELADLLDQAGEHEQALSHSLLALRRNPMSPVTAGATFQRLGETHSRELTFTVACILSFLGHTTNRVVDLVASQRGAALPKPTRCLSEEDYTFGLDVTATDPELTRLLAQLEPFARQLELPKPKQQRALLDSLRAEDVERSTTMLARTFGWTCRLLTLGAPNLFLTDTDALPHLLPVESTSFAVGKALGRGLSLPELTFVWGRALAWSRPQTRILYSLPSAARLQQFLRGCRAASGIDETPSGETKALAKVLKKEVPSASWANVTANLAALGTESEERVERWKHAADQVANRMGLLACGDPELAARTLDRFPTVDGGSRKKQLSELLSFALSDEYQELRRRLGLHLG